MFELLAVLLFVWLFGKVLGLTFRVTWGLAKAVAVGLFALALPVLLVGLLITGGLLLVIPVALAAAAWGILKACV